MESTSKQKKDQRRSLPSDNVTTPLRKSKGDPKSTTHKRTKSNYLPSSIVIIPNCNCKVSQANQSVQSENKSNSIYLSLPQSEKALNNLDTNNSTELKKKRSLFEKTEITNSNNEQEIHINLKLNKHQRNLSQASNCLKIFINFEDEEESLDSDIQTRPKAKSNYSKYSGTQMKKLPLNLEKLKEENSNEADSLQNKIKRTQLNKEEESETNKSKININWTPNKGKRGSSLYTKPVKINEQKKLNRDSISFLNQELKKSMRKSQNRKPLQRMTSKEYSKDLLKLVNATNKYKKSKSKSHYEMTNHLNDITQTEMNYLTEKTAMNYNNLTTYTNAQNQKTKRVNTENSEIENRIKDIFIKNNNLTSGDIDGMHCNCETYRNFYFKNPLSTSASKRGTQLKTKRMKMAELNYFKMKKKAMKRKNSEVFNDNEYEIKMRQRLSLFPFTNTDENQLYSRLLGHQTSTSPNVRINTNAIEKERNGPLTNRATVKDDRSLRKLQKHYLDINDEVDSFQSELYSDSESDSDEYSYEYVDELGVKVNVKKIKKCSLFENRDNSNNNEEEYEYVDSNGNVIQEDNIVKKRKGRNSMRYKDSSDFVNEESTYEFIDEKGKPINIKKIISKKKDPANSRVVHFEVEDENGHIVKATKSKRNQPNHSYYIDNDDKKVKIDIDKCIKDQSMIDRDENNNKFVFIDTNGNPIKQSKILSYDQNNNTYTIVDVNGNINKATKVYLDHKKKGHHRKKQISNDFDESLNNSMEYFKNNCQYIDNKGNVVKVKKVLSNSESGLSSFEVEDESGKIIKVTRVFNMNNKLMNNPSQSSIFYEDPYRKKPFKGPINTTTLDQDKINKDENNNNYIFVDRNGNTLKANKVLSSKENEYTIEDDKGNVVTVSKVFIPKGRLSPINKTNSDFLSSCMSNSCIFVDNKGNVVKACKVISQNDVPLVNTKESSSKYLVEDDKGNIISVSKLLSKKNSTNEFSKPFYINSKGNKVLLNPKQIAMVEKEKEDISLLFVDEDGNVIKTNKVISTPRDNYSNAYEIEDEDGKIIKVSKIEIPDSKDSDNDLSQIHYYIDNKGNKVVVYDKSTIDMINTLLDEKDNEISYIDEKGNAINVKRIISRKDSINSKYEAEDENGNIVTVSKMITMTKPYYLDQRGNKILLNTEQLESVTKEDKDFVFIDNEGKVVIANKILNSNLEDNQCLIEDSKGNLVTVMKVIEQKSNDKSMIEYLDEKGNVVNVKKIIAHKGDINEEKYIAEDINGNTIVVTKEIKVAKPYYIDNKGNMIELNNKQIKEIKNNTDKEKTVFIDNKGNIISASSSKVISYNKDSNQYQLEDKEGNIVNVSKVVIPVNSEEESTDRTYQYIDMKGNVVTINKVISHDGDLKENKYTVEDENGNIITVSKVVSMQSNISTPYYTDKKGNIITLTQEQIKQIKSSEQPSFIDSKGNLIKVTKVISSDSTNNEYKVEDEEGNIVTVSKVIIPKQKEEYDYIDEEGNIVNVGKVLQLKKDLSDLNKGEEKYEVKDVNGNVRIVTKILSVNKPYYTDSKGNKVILSNEQIKEVENKSINNSQLLFVDKEGSIVTANKIIEVDKKKNEYTIEDKNGNIITVSKIEVPKEKESSKQNYEFVDKKGNVVKAKKIIGKSNNEYQVEDDNGNIVTVSKVVSLTKPYYVNQEGKRISLNTSQISQVANKTNSDETVFIDNKGNIISSSKVLSYNKESNLYQVEDKEGNIINVSKIIIPESFEEKKEEKPIYEFVDSSGKAIDVKKIISSNSDTNEIIIEDTDGNIIKATKQTTKLITKPYYTDNEGNKISLSSNQLVQIESVKDNKPLFIDSTGQIVSASEIISTPLSNKSNQYTIKDNTGNIITVSKIVIPEEIIHKSFDYIDEKGKKVQVKDIISKETNEQGEEIITIEDQSGNIIPVTKVFKSQSTPTKQYRPYYVDDNGEKVLLTSAQLQKMKVENEENTEYIFVDEKGNQIKAEEAIPISINTYEIKDENGKVLKATKIYLKDKDEEMKYYIDPKGNKVYLSENIVNSAIKSNNNLSSKDLQSNIQLTFGNCDFVDEKGNVIRVAQIISNDDNEDDKYEVKDNEGNIITVTKKTSSTKNVYNPYYIDSKGQKVVLKSEDIEKINKDEMNNSCLFVDEKGNLVKANRIVSNKDNQYEIEDENGNTITVSKVDIVHNKNKSSYGYVDQKGNVIKIKNIISEKNDSNNKEKKCFEVEDENGNIITIHDIIDIEPQEELNHSYYIDKDNNKVKIDVDRYTKDETMIEKDEDNQRYVFIDNSGNPVKQSKIISYDQKNKTYSIVDSNGKINTVTKVYIDKNKDATVYSYKDEKGNIVKVNKILSKEDSTIPNLFKVEDENGNILTVSKVITNPMIRNASQESLLNKKDKELNKTSNTDINYTASASQLLNKDNLEVNNKKVKNINPINTSGHEYKDNEKMKMEVKNNPNISRNSNDLSNENSKKNSLKQKNIFRSGTKGSGEETLNSKKSLTNLQNGQNSYKLFENTTIASPISKNTMTAGSEEATLLIGSRAISLKKEELKNIDLGNVVEDGYHKEKIEKEKSMKSIDIKEEEKDQFYDKYDNKEEEIQLHNDYGLKDIVKQNNLHRRNLQSNLNSFQRGLSVNTAHHKPNKSIDIKLRLGQLVQLPNKDIKIGCNTTKNLYHVKLANHNRTRSTNDEMLYHLNENKEDKFSIKQKSLSRKLNKLSEMMKKKIANELKRKEKKKEEKKENKHEKKEIFYIRKNDQQYILPPNAMIVKEYGYFKK